MTTHTQMNTKTNDMTAQWTAIQRPDGTIWIQGNPDMDGWREVCVITDKRFAPLIAGAPELLQIAKAYRNLLKTMAHTDGEIATYHHIVEVISRAEGRGEA